MFWRFFTEFTGSERVLMAEIMVAGAGDSVGGCDSKTACGSALFLCSAGYGVGGELAVGASAGGCKMASLSAVGLT
jgi:hypothetical protein